MMLQSIVPGGCIYGIRNRHNLLIYVGSTVVGPRRRLGQHLAKLRRGAHHSIHLQRAWNKYGAQSFEFVIFEWVSDANFLYPREQFWIWHLRSNNPAHGYNATEFADSPRSKRLSETTRQKIAGALRGRALSEEHKQSLRVASLKRTDKQAVGEAMRAGRMRRGYDTAWCAAISKGKTGHKAANRGTVMTDQQKAKISQSKMGVPWSAARRAAQEKARAAH